LLKRLGGRGDGVVAGPLRTIAYTPDLPLSMLVLCCSVHPHSSGAQSGTRRRTPHPRRTPNAQITRRARHRQARQLRLAGVLPNGAEHVLMLRPTHTTAVPTRGPAKTGPRRPSTTRSQAAETAHPASPRRRASAGPTGGCPIERSVRSVTAHSIEPTPTDHLRALVGEDDRGGVPVGEQYRALDRWRYRLRASRLRDPSG
jgi:hypothetical protein